MSKGRIEAFTDAIIAIVMTLLVLELKEPVSGSWQALGAQIHVLAVYFISFITLAIYWNNHHHLFSLVKTVNGRVLWANNFFILGITLFPYATVWVSEHLQEQAPQLLYGVILLFTDLTYWFLGKSLVRANGPESAVGQLFRGYWKTRLTLILNLVALLAGWLIAPLLVMIIDFCAILLWVIPEKKAEPLHQAE